MRKMRYTLKGGSILEIETETSEEFRECFREIIAQDNGHQIKETKTDITAILADEEIDEKLPRNGEIEKYILERPHFRFSIAELTQKFLGARLKFEDNKALYNRLYKRVLVAKNKIAKEHNGKWETKRKGSRNSRIAEYVFTPIKIN